MIVLSVRWDVAKTSLNARLHWRQRARLNRLARLAAYFAWMEAGKPRARGPVEVSITVRRGRLIDPDNALAGCKSLIDELFNEAITPDDSAKRISFQPVRQETGKQYRGAEEVVFTIREAIND